MESLPSLLHSALTDVVQSLGDFAADPLFAEKFSLVFGADALSAGRFAALVANLPAIEILPNGVLDGAAGAFSAQTGKIYLSESVVNGDPALLRAVLLEEVGHYLDSVVNTQDASGDEGELFSALVRGIELSPWELDRLKTENDQAVVMIGGYPVAIERSVITLNVNTEFDENDGSATIGSGLSLRDAIIIANNDINNDYIVNLASGVTYFLIQGLANEDNGLAGDLDIKNGANITIRTNGSAPATINASTVLGGDRVIEVRSGGALTLDQVIITGGKSTYGGGVYNDGSLNIFRTTINNNEATYYGGGIYNDSGATLSIFHSTINNNSTSGSSSSYSGGGVYNYSSLTISNSTVSGNSSNGNGGGIVNYYGNLLSTNTTVTNNVADADNSGSGDGGGIYNVSSSSSALALRNTIVANNFDTPNNNGSGTKNPDITGPVQGNANNLIGNLTGASGTIGTGSDIVLAAGQSAGLGPLANNGGITRTHALLSGSPAINAGLNVLIGTDLSDSDGDTNLTELMPNDQRGAGFVRVSGSSVDIGAFEVQATAPNPTITLAVSPASVLEDGTANLVYTFTRGGSTTGALTVNYGITGTANATDYTGATPGTGKTITFAAGSATATLTIDPTADTTVEPDETVILTLATGTGYTIGATPSATGTITNDDTTTTNPSITLAVSPASVLEDGTSNLVYTFTRGGSTTGALTVNYGITGTANATDYTGATPGTGKTITFAAGSATATLTIDPTADTTIEPDETVILTLATGTGYTLGTTGGVIGAITNDDPNTATGVTLIGDDDDDYLLGGAGNDTLQGLGGNDILNGGPGADILEGGEGSDAYYVDNSGDVVADVADSDPGEIDTVFASITYTLPNTIENLVMLNTGNANDNINATGNSLNNKLTGNSGNNSLSGLAGKDVLNGKSGNDSLNGGAGRDTLTGGAGADIFIFRFGESTVAAPDRITDFAIGADKIDLLTQAGAATAAPTAFSRALDSSLATLTNVVNAVFTDANGATAGNQSLGVNSAALVTVTTAGIVGTYLIINDGTAGFQSTNDSVVNITGFSGALPAFGAIPVGNFFV